MSTYEEDLRQALKTEFDAGCLREVENAVDVFAALAKSYPTSGSKIDWKRIPGAIERAEVDVSLHVAAFVEFFDRMRARFRLAGPVLYVGDSATDFVLEGSVDVMRRVLPYLVEIPQHHYFVGPNCAWCLCLTMEGDMGFGAASPSHHLPDGSVRSATPDEIPKR